MKNISKYIKVGLLGSVLFIANSCEDKFKEVTSPSGQTIVQLVSTNNDFNILTAAAVRTGLSLSLSNINSGPFTVFAPTDNAFVTYFRTLLGNSSLDEAGVLAVVNNLQPTATSPTPTLANVTTLLNYHIVSSTIASSTFANSQVYVMQSGSRLSISKPSGTVLNANIFTAIGAATGANVTAVDTKASNGLIHTIDRVLVAPASNNIWVGTNTGTIVNLPAFNVNYGTSPITITVFGTAMPRFSDGSINVASAATGTANDYNLISAAIARANLAPVIIPNVSPFPDFTLFAPTDAAFISYLGVANEAAGITAINGLAPDALANILRYHVVVGRVVSTDLSNGQSVATAQQGKNFTISISGSTITLVDTDNNIANPTVTVANVLTNAGVLHQINGVLR